MVSLSGQLRCPIAGGPELNRRRRNDLVSAMGSGPADALEQCAKLAGRVGRSGGMDRWSTAVPSARNHGPCRPCCSLLPLEDTMTSKKKNSKIADLPKKTVSNKNASAVKGGAKLKKS